MSFLELAKRRYSVRQYESKKVEPEKLAKILEAGRVAPTGHNTQPQRLIVIQEASSLAKLKKAANVYGAPLAIIVCADRHTAWVRSYDKKNIAEIDASIITDHMMLEATELGLGTVWICNFEPAVLKQQFALPEGFEPVNILAIGYAAGEIFSPDRHAKNRKPLQETVFYEQLDIVK